MTEPEPQDSFGSGLRAHLGRLSAGAEGPDAGPGAPAPPSATAVPPRPPTLEEREEAQRDRERRFEQHVRAFEAHAAALARREQQLLEREAALERLPPAPEQRRPVRDVLREHAESSTPRLLTLFDEALAATHANGTPDHGVRLAAVRILLGEAYATGDASAATAAAMDELAALRERRTADAPGS